MSRAFLPSSKLFFEPSGLEDPEPLSPPPPRPPSVLFADPSMLSRGWVAAEWAFPGLPFPFPPSSSTSSSFPTTPWVCVFGGEAMAQKLVPRSLFNHCILEHRCVVLCSLPGTFLLSLSKPQGGSGRRDLKGKPVDMGASSGRKLREDLLVEAALGLAVSQACMDWASGGGLSSWAGGWGSLRQGLAGGGLRPVRSHLHQLSWLLGRVTPTVM